MFPVRLRNLAARPGRLERGRGEGHQGPYSGLLSIAHFFIPPKIVKKSLSCFSSEDFILPIDASSAFCLGFNTCAKNASQLCPSLPANNNINWFEPALGTSVCLLAELSSLPVQGQSLQGRKTSNKSISTRLLHEWFVGDDLGFLNKQLIYLSAKNSLERAIVRLLHTRLTEATPAEVMIILLTTTTITNTTVVIRLLSIQLRYPMTLIACLLLHLKLVYVKSIGRKKRLNSY